MARPRIRKPPRRPDDSLLLDYDYAPRYGWGTYPIRNVRNGARVVWEERDNVSDSHDMVKRLDTHSLHALAELGRRMKGKKPNQPIMPKQQRGLSQVSFD